MQSNQEIIAQFYIGYFNRAPDPIGLAHWVAQIEAGRSLQSIAQAFSVAPEATALYEFLESPSTAGIQPFLEAVYTNLFGRAPDPAGLNFWKVSLENGKPVGSVILEIIQAAQGADAEIIANKVEVGVYWASKAELAPDFVYDAAALENAKLVLGMSADTAESVTAAKIEVDLFFGENRSSANEPAAGEAPAEGAPPAPVDNTGNNNPPAADPPANLPAQVSLENTLATFDETADSGAPVKFADIVVTDDGQGNNVLGLAGSDAGLFEINGSELFLKANQLVDFETNPALDVQVTIDDNTIGGSPDDSVDLSVTVSDLNEAPTAVVLQNTLIELPENSDTSARIKIADVAVTDDALGTNTLALTGSDATFFELDGQVLYLKAGTPLDFDADPSLELSVTADDPTVGNTPDVTGSIFTLNIIEVDETPVIVELPDDVPSASELAQGARGFKIIGENGLDQAGHSVSSAGDINDDGIDDLLIGAYGNDGGGNSAGAAYIVFGANNLLPPNGIIRLDSVASGSGGFKIVGEHNIDLAGFSVSGAGDVNDDGISDIIIGAYGQDAGGASAGAAYVVYGQANMAPVDGELLLSDIANGSGGFKLVGEAANDYAGQIVTDLGDINDDGFDDVALGAYAHDAGKGNNGASYVIYGADGGPNPRDGTIDLGLVAGGTFGFKIIGEAANDNSGYAISGAGDLNGDSISDVVIGGLGDDTGGQNAGAAYIVFGASDIAPVGGTLDLSSVGTTTAGVKIIGKNAGDLTGNAVSAAGDVNGDGIGDLIIGAEDSAAGGALSGAAYVVFGATGLEPENGIIDLDEIAGGNGGFKIIGEAAGDQAGISVASAGDVNGDGHADLLVGAFHHDGDATDSGAAYLIFGAAGLSPDAGTINLDTIAQGIGGFKFSGETSEDYLGRSVSAAGDVNGDGFDDLIIGAHLHNADHDDAGAAYILYGMSNFSDLFA